MAHKQTPIIRSRWYQQAVRDWERNAPTVATEARTWADKIDAAEAEALAAPAIAEARREALTRFVQLHYHGVSGKAFAALADVPDSNRNKYQRHFTIAKAINDDVPAPMGGSGVDSWRPAFETMSLTTMGEYIRGFRKGQRKAPTVQELAAKALDGILKRVSSLQSIPESGKRDWCIANLGDIVSACLDPDPEQRLSAADARALLDVRRADGATGEPQDDEETAEAEATETEETLAVANG